ncbi:CUB domain-containing protein 2 [Ixodes scapularis]
MSLMSRVVLFTTYILILTLPMIYCCTEDDESNVCKPHGVECTLNMDCCCPLMCDWWLRTCQTRFSIPTCRLNFASVSLLLGLCWPFANGRNTRCQTESEKMTRVRSAVCVWWLRSRLNFASVSLLLGLCWPFANGRNTTCGGFLTQFRGSFQSPNYPDHYDDLSECRWYIFAPREFAILIEKHSIDIEDDAARADCPYDHLKYSFGNWKKTFCGRGLVEPILLDTNFVTVILKTDASMSGSGFNISYRFVLPPCAQTFTASQGLMEIPEDKSKRTAVILRRRWCFRSSRGNTYQFTFDYFDTVGDPPKCKHMYLKVLEKNEGQMRSHPRLCGKVIPEPVHTRSSSVSLLFLSDRALDKNGLHVRWKVFGCNEDRSEPSGQLRFPRDGVFIAYPATCVWTLIASQDQTVELSVRKLNLERCDVEYLRVFEGQEEGRALLDDLCQLDSSVVITSTRRVMSLHLRMQSLREEAVEASYQLKAVRKLALRFGRVSFEADV